MDMNEKLTEMIQEVSRATAARIREEQMEGLRILMEEYGQEVDIVPDGDGLSIGFLGNIGEAEAEALNILARIYMAAFEYGVNTGIAVTVEMVIAAKAVALAEGKKRDAKRRNDIRLN